MYVSKDSIRWMKFFWVRILSVSCPSASWLDVLRSVHLLDDSIKSLTKQVNRI